MLLSRIFAADAPTPSPFADYWYEPRGIRTGSGVEITPESAMTLAAVYACVRVISETIASVPLHVYQRVGDDSKRPATNHPLEDLLHDQPNRWQTAIEFRQMMTAFALLRKFGIAEMIPGPRGPVDQLKPLHPDLVREEIIASTGVHRYLYRDPLQDGVERVLLDDEVFVLRGEFGRSVLDYARETFGLGLSMERYAAKLFGRGSRHTGVLSHPKTLSDPARANLRSAIDEYQVGGAREGRPMILEEGMTWQSVTITNKDAEFLSSRKFNNADVARFFGVPLHKIAELDRSTNNNIEQQAIEFVTDTMMPWAERWEQAIRRDLILAPQTYFAEHNLDGLMRGNLQARYEAYAIGRQWGWLSTNDIRRRENMNPIAGGDDDYLTPLNMTTGGLGGPTAIEFAPRPSAEAMHMLHVLVHDAAARVVRKEQAAIGKLGERTGATGEAWHEGVAAFYREHAEFVASVLRLDLAAAGRYAAAQCGRVLADGPAILVDDDGEIVSDLTSLALQVSAPLRLAA